MALRWLGASTEAVPAEVALSSRPGRALEAAGVAVLASAVLLLSAAAALSQPIWSVIDENLHFAYAQALADGHGLPRVDQPVAVIPNASEVDWNARITILNPEAAQPPLNYVLLAGAYRAAMALPGATPRTAVYAMRLSNSVLFAGLVLLLWLSGRLIRPHSLATAWALPATCLIWVGAIIDSTRAGNDVLVGCLTALALYLALRWRDQLGWRRGLLIGSVVALATLAKYSGAYSLAAVTILFLAAGTRRPKLAVGLAAVWLAWAAEVAPWFALQYIRYGDPGATAQFRRAIQPWDYLPVVQAGTIGAWARSALQSLLFGESSLPTWTAAQQLLGLVLVGLGVLAVAAAVEAGRRTALTRLEYAALLVNVPGFFLFESALSLRSGVILADRGRYLLPIALPLALLVAAGPLLLGLRRRPHLPEAGGVPSS